MGASVGEVDVIISCFGDGLHPQIAKTTSGITNPIPFFIFNFIIILLLKHELNEKSPFKFHILYSAIMRLTWALSARRFMQDSTNSL